MSHRLCAAAVALTLLAHTPTAVGQVRIGGDGSRPAPIGRIRTAPPPSSPGIRTERPISPTTRSTAGLRFVRPPVDDGRFFVVWPIGLGWSSFAYVPIDLWNGVTLAQIADGVLARPLESAPAGGIQLDIEPRSAQVYVDGVYVGVVGDFKGYYEHLDLIAGPHVITIVAPDYVPLTLQVVVVPGYTTTHRATLTRAYGR